ncbi:adenylate/guanylate cyclase domain-containing protein [Ruegeria sp. Alg231-54]|uniref:adenylate/guanylate cyclase domain-containing protein n=1 Tax=Ruegeria sp. Alg231-54 TaxID=1922221 RepID=UPI00131F477B|nr:adenylate/guanylate cyclase domain-containing protein [Ruegeria sp. Alg231-54]
MERKLVAILAADVVGYSRMMRDDEEATLATLATCRTIIDGLVESAGGRIFGSAGDSVLAEFHSSVAAVRTALKIQHRLTTQNADLSESSRMVFRIGVNLGDVVSDGDNLLGDGVNVAARLETLAPPGGICISRQVAEQIAGKLDEGFASAGLKGLKNIPTLLEVFVWPATAARSIRTQPKYGRWAAAIALVATLAIAAFWYSHTLPSASKLPTGARIALVPFKNLSAEPGDTYFSDGLSRDINALLARFSNLFVIAPEAMLAFRDDTGCENLREKLGADFILRGTVQRSADQLRVTTTLTDAKSCRQLTSPGPFDVDLNAERLLEVQLDIARKVASAIGSSDAPLFKSAIAQEIRNKAPDSLDAYECVFLSFWFYQTFTIEDHRIARDCLLRTVETEPDYSLAWSRLAYNYLESKKRQMDTPPDWSEKALRAANNALDADRDNPDAYYALAIHSRMVGESTDIFRNYAQRAIELNPNDSWILADLGIFLAYSGEWEAGEAWITRARELNPQLHPGYGNAFHLHAIVRGDYDEALAVIAGMGGARRPMNMTSTAAALALNGELDAARDLANELRKDFPDAVKDPLAPFRARDMPKDLIDKLQNGLKLAGLDA